MNDKQKKLTQESIRRPVLGSNQQVSVADYQAMFDLAFDLLADEPRTSQLPAMSIAEFRAHLAQCVAEVADWPDWKRNQLRSGDSK